MTLAHAYRAIVPFLMFVLVACGSPGDTAPTATPVALSIVVPTTTPIPASSAPESSTTAPITAPVTVTAQLSFAPVTYTDTRAGFELNYPVTWTLDPSSQIGVRGGQALLLSPGTTLETIADGGTRVSITTYTWDPKHDLDAYVAQRKTAWDASGFAIVQEDQWQLADDRAVYSFVINTPEQPSFTLLTTIGEEYLQISGEGDAALVEEIARTLRPLN